MGVRERVEPARRRHEHTRPAGLAHGLDVTRRQVHRVRVVEQFPWQFVRATRPQPRAQHGDRALAIRVEVHERAPLRLGAVATLHAHAVLPQLSVRAMPDLVVAEGGEESGFPRQLAQLDGGNSTPTRRLLERLGRVHDLACPRHVRHLGKLAPLAMPHHRNTHRRELVTSGR